MIRRSETVDMDVDEDDTRDVCMYTLYDVDTSNMCVIHVILTSFTPSPLVSYRVPPFSISSLELLG